MYYNAKNFYFNKYVHNEIYFQPKDVLEVEKLYTSKYYNSPNTVLIRYKSNQDFKNYYLTVVDVKIGIAYNPYKPYGSMVDMCFMNGVRITKELFLCINVRVRQHTDGEKITIFNHDIVSPIGMENIKDRFTHFSIEGISKYYPTNDNKSAVYFYTDKHGRRRTLAIVFLDTNKNYYCMVKLVEHELITLVYCVGVD